MGQINFMRMQRIERYIKENASNLEPLDYQQLIFGFSSYFGARTYDKGFLDFITSNVDVTI